jgi:hypothetical protein
MKRIDGKAGKRIVALTMVCYAVFMWFVIFPTMQIEPLNTTQMKAYDLKADDKLLITNAEQIEKFDDFIRQYKFRKTYKMGSGLDYDFPGYTIILNGDREYEIRILANNYIRIEDEQYSVIDDQMDYDFLNDFFATNKKLADKNNVTKDTFQLVP